MANDNFDDLPDLPPMDDEPRRGSFTQKIFSKAETIIPIILILLFLFFFAVAVLGYDASGIPVLGSFLGGTDAKKQILVLGEPMYETRQMFGDSDYSQLYTFRYMEPESLNRNPYDRIKGYNAIIIDQWGSSNKALPESLFRDLKRYVKNGGNVFLVANSAYLSLGSNDLYGWEANFGADVTPVECPISRDYLSTCERPLRVNGILEKSDYSNKIITVERIPASSSLGDSLSLTLYDVTPTRGSTEWMLIKDALTNKTYPGILHKSSFTGGDFVYVNFHELFTIKGVFLRIMQSLI